MRFEDGEDKPGRVESVKGNTAKVLEAMTVKDADGKQVALYGSYCKEMTFTRRANKAWVQKGFQDPYLRLKE